MAYVITDACVGNKDGGCVDTCPADCIHPHRDEPGFEEAEQLHIDPVACIDCDACVDMCPHDAIYRDRHLPDDLRDFLEVNARYYR